MVLLWVCLRLVEIFTENYWGLQSWVSSLQCTFNTWILVKMYYFYIKTSEWQHLKILKFLKSSGLFLKLHIKDFFVLLCLWQKGGGAPFQAKQTTKKPDSYPGKRMPHVCSTIKNKNKMLAKKDRCFILWKCFIRSFNMQSCLDISTMQSASINVSL